MWKLEAQFVKRPFKNNVLRHQDAGGALRRFLYEPPPVPVVPTVLVECIEGDLGRASDPLSSSAAAADGADGAAEDLRAAAALTDTPARFCCAGTLSEGDEFGGPASEASLSLVSLADWAARTDFL